MIFKNNYSITMEIETNETKNEKLEYNSNQINNFNLLLGVKLTSEDLNLFQDMNELNLLVNNKKFYEKKKSDQKDTISDEIKSIQNLENLQKLREEKSKRFYEIFKINGKTTIYHTAEKDDLSQTMHAFYFCDKSKQILSDKQIAEYKALHFDTGYELPLVRALALKDEDNMSSYSNLKQKNNINDNIKTEAKLKKKRKASNNFSNKSKNNKKKKQEKVNINEEYNNKSKNAEGGEEQEADYCISKCKYGRKSKDLPMIQCDKCKQWYHTKCLNFTNEHFQKVQSKNIWYCPDCSKMDIDDKKIIDSM